MLITGALFAAALFVAYANGANDNFKGVATLFGGNAASYRTAITLATVTTFAGAVSSVFIAHELVQAFSGKGLVPDAVAASPHFLLSVALAAGATVILATLLGLPISTTHALTGGLLGAGLAAVGPTINFSRLGTAFFLPLLLGPVLAVALVVPVYKAAGALTRRFGIVRESCVCVGQNQFAPVQFAPRGAAVLAAPAITVGTVSDCVERYQGRLWGVSAQAAVTALHYTSASVVSFARGLNDTPKIVGLLLVIQAMNIPFGMVAIAVAMAIGGLINARKVALTMSRRITRMNEGQALSANLVTGLLVILASRYGLPVSTTHVSVGAISGIALTHGTANKSVLSGILASWLATLPLAAVLAGAIFWIFNFYQ